MPTTPRTADPVALARRLRGAPARLGPVRLVTVDGPAGSGKTTLAAAMSSALDDAPVVHLDDLYEGWAGLAEPLWARLEDWVLGPLRAGRPGRYRRYDWHARRFAEWHDVPVHEALVVEGVGSGARPVDGSASLRVWVEAPWPLRLERGIARDGEAMRGEWERWAEREAAHFGADGTRQRADALVDGTRPPAG